MPLLRDILWSSIEDEGFEHLRLLQEGNRIIADGVVVRRDEESAYRAAYRIECDETWRIHRVEVTTADGAQLELQSDGDGHWHDRPDLDGCHDVDIEASPFTNTLAIRRLALAPGASQEIAVVFVTPGDDGAQRMMQRYTRISEDRYLYESMESDFKAELPVDGDGLLLEYPNWFRRVWGVTESR
ncbi:MAG TPA: putative glycolipid-binding domain-containing protein [Thermoanaerobaculia bacterium]|nr:putative glycolipid-binding domain-containing protein [Thermoanaerobaculia bacterium]